MSEATATDAELTLRLFELRREEKMRKARHWFLFEYKAGTWEEMKATFNTGAEEDNYLRMVTSFWNMACAMVNMGAINRELFFRTNGEFIMVWKKIEPWVEDARKALGRASFMKDLEDAAHEALIWRERDTHSTK